MCMLLQFCTLCCKCNVLKSLLQQHWRLCCTDRGRSSSGLIWRRGKLNFSTQWSLSFLTSLTSAERLRLFAQYTNSSSCPWDPPIETRAFQFVISVLWILKNYKKNSKTLRTNSACFLCYYSVHVEHSSSLNNGNNSWPEFFLLPAFPNP